MWSALLSAIFPESDKAWTWRRRMAFMGCWSFLGCFVYAVGWLPPDWGAVVMVQSLAGWTFTMGIYYKGSHEDQKLADQFQEKLLLADPPKKTSGS